MAQLSSKTSDQASLHPDVEIVHFEHHSIARSPHGEVHYRLSVADGRFLASLRRPGGPTETLTRSQRALLAQANDDGFLSTSPTPTEERVSSFETRHFESLAGWAYRSGMRLLFTRRGAVVAIGLALVALVALLFDVTRRGAGEVANPAWELAAVALLVLGTTMMHELGHAAVLVANGRRVGNAGFDLHLASLSFYVDASDAMMLERPKRILQALAGVYLDLLGAGALASVALVSDGSVRSVCVRVSALLLVDIALNLVPAFELDGYWVLSDLLDEPQLGRRSATALRRWLGHPTSRPDRFVWYGLLGGAAAVLMIAAAIRVQIFVFWPYVVGALRDGGVLAVIVLAQAVPLALAVAAAMNQARWWLLDHIVLWRQRAVRARLSAHVCALAGDEDPLTDRERQLLRRRFIPDGTSVVDESHLVFAVTDDCIETLDDPRRSESESTIDGQERWVLSTDALRQLGLLS